MISKNNDLRSYAIEASDRLPSIKVLLNSRKYFWDRLKVKMVTYKHLMASIGFLSSGEALSQHLNLTCFPHIVDSEFIAVNLSVVVGSQNAYEI